MSAPACPRCGSEVYEYLDYGGCSVCRPREEREAEDVAVTLPEGGLPHGEHPHDYGAVSRLKAWIHARWECRKRGHKWALDLPFGPNYCERCGKAVEW